MADEHFEPTDATFHAQSSPFLSPASPSPPSPSPEIGPDISRRLYISHFLSTWNSRIFEFGAILFIAAVFPGTLLPASLYALVRTAAAICLTPAVGRYIDRGNRLEVVRFSIIVQRLAVTASCLGLWSLALDLSAFPWLRPLILVLLAVMACAEKLSSIMNTIAIERDWVIVIAEHDESGLQVLNAQMRRIDLFCKLFGPLAISLIDGISTTIAIWVTLGLNVVSVTVEYFAIAEVYKRVPALQMSQTHLLRPDTPDSISSATNFFCHLSTYLISSTRSIRKELSFYTRHSVFIPSIALSLLYLTVLSFSGQMVTYLLSAGYTSTHIGLARTLSVAFEMSATWLAPLAMNKIGPTRAGLWFINWQAVCVVVAISFFWGTQLPFLAASGLVFGVIASRIGLWGFDLCVQIIIQEEVEPDSRGAFSSIEISFQNIFELFSYMSTIVFARPQQFRYPVLMSSLAVLVAGGLYAEFVRRRRGHLLHISSCVGGKEREGIDSAGYEALGIQIFGELYEG
ncbi:Ferroporti-1 [Trichophaea hybrida]|nr:Ferroporti-1 [Trichophaea hybrida]